MQNFSTRGFLKHDISGYLSSLCLAAMLAILAGCGGGGSSTTSTTSTTTSTATAAAIQLLASSPQIVSSGTTAVDLTAVVLGATRQAVAGRTVTFSTGTDTTAFVNSTSASGVSDANGLVTAKLNIGANKANRTITVSATADSATATNTVDVTGTTITVSGSSSLAFSASTTLTFSVKDSAGTAIPGVAVTATSQTGNAILRSPATGITNGAGQITATVTATAAGNDVITATAAGATTTQAVAISGASFNFTAPTLALGAASIDIPLNTPTPVSINWTNNGAPQVGSAVTFSTSRGTVAGSPAVTNALGNTTGATVQSTSATGAGPAIITASGPGGVPAATVNVIFVATTATNATVQAIPGTVAFTTGSVSQNNNTSVISVLVRDLSNNLVKNASVNFTITADTSGGRLTASNVTTDVSGSASVTYIAGATSSPANGVVISATVTAVNGVALGAAVTGNTTLTVAGQALLVRLGTDNLVGGIAPLNTKVYLATVTDAAGNPVVGQTVRFALRPGRFLKGNYVAGIVVWGPVVRTVCPNEDVNFNGILDAGEDLNASGALEPGGVATVNATGTTDASGNATATISYPKDHSTWTEVILEARSGVAGNDPPATVNFFLPGASADYANLTVAPPGQTSPYGAGAGANNTCANLF